jgi:hypothetical protein
MTAIAKTNRSGKRYSRFSARRDRDRDETVVIKRGHDHDRDFDRDRKVIIDRDR